MTTRAPKTRTRTRIPKTACALALILLAGGHARAAVAKDLETSLLWRSTQLPNDQIAIFGSLTRLIATNEGLYCFDEQTREALFISRDGERVEHLEVEGEAPGHIFMVADVDVDPQAKYLAVVEGSMPGKAEIRSPIRPPFALTRDVTPSSDLPGVRFGISARIRWPWVAVHCKEQPFGKADQVFGRITLQNLATGESFQDFRKSSRLSFGQVGPDYWVWGLGPNGIRYVSDDNNSMILLAIAPAGRVLWKADLPVKEARKSDAMLEGIKKSYEPLKKVKPGIPVVVDETYRRIEAITCREDTLYVLTSEGSRRGESSRDSVEWLVLAADTGHLIERLTLHLPLSLDVFIKATFDGRTMYVLGRSRENTEENELFSFGVTSSGDQ